MQDNSINQIKSLAKVYAGIDVREYCSEITHWEDCINWVNRVMATTDNYLQPLRIQISQIWLVPGSACELSDEF